MGDCVNIAARLESIAAPGAICLSEDAYRQVKGRVELAVSDLGLTKLKNIAEPVRVYLLRLGEPLRPTSAQTRLGNDSRRRASRWSFCRSPTSEATLSRSISSME